MSVTTRSVPCAVQVGLARASYPLGRLEFGPAHLVLHGAGAPCVLDARDVVGLEAAPGGVRVRHASITCPAYVSFGNDDDAGALIARIRAAGFSPAATPDRELAPRLPATLFRVPLEPAIALTAAALAALALLLPLWV